MNVIEENIFYKEGKDINLRIIYLVLKKEFLGQNSLVYNY